MLSNWVIERQILSELQKPGGQFNCSVAYSIHFSVEFYRVSHSSRKLNRIFNRAIELTPYFIALDDIEPLPFCASLLSNLSVVAHEKDHENGGY